MNAKEYDKIASKVNNRKMREHIRQFISLCPDARKGKKCDGCDYEVSEVISSIMDETLEAIGMTNRKPKKKSL